MDFQHRAGGKYRQGMMMSSQEQKTDLKERQRRLLLDNIDISKDPYLFQNQLGKYECRLCLGKMFDTTGTYLAHTKRSKHQQNLQKRLAYEMKKQKQIIKPKINMHKNDILRIGTPAFNIKKELDPISSQRVIKFIINYPKIIQKTKPEFKIISAYEQKIEQPNPNYLYILFAADPYQTICIKIPNQQIDLNDDKTFKMWDKKKKQFIVIVTYKNQKLQLINYQIKLILFVSVNNLKKTFIQNLHQYFYLRIFLWIIFNHSYQILKKLKFQILLRV